MERLARRRAVFGGLLAGGGASLAAAGPARAAGGWTPRSLRVNALRVGDVVLAPDGASRRVALVRRTASRGYRVFVTDDVTGKPVALDDRRNTRGIAGSATVLVLARGIGASSLPSAAPRVIDAGDPKDTSLRLFRGTAAQWASVDLVLAAGEPGFELDTMRLKIGDGGTRWSDLPYVAGAGSTGATTLTHFVGDDLDLRRPAHDGPVDWVTTTDGVPTQIRTGDWITRVERA